MRLLALDAANAACSAAMRIDGATVAALSEPMQRGQAEHLLPMAAEVLQRAGCAPLELDAVAVTVGPGAFTGIRIGLSAARAFGLAVGVPVIGVTCFEIWRHACRDEGRLVVALETKRSDVYLQAFDAAGAAVAGPASLEPEAAPAWLPPGRWALTGDAAMRLVSVLGEADARLAIVAPAPAVDASTVAEVAEARIGRDGLPPPDAPPPRPLYLRPPDVNPKPRAPEPVGPGRTP